MNRSLIGMLVVIVAFIAWFILSQQPMSQPSSPTESLGGEAPAPPHPLSIEALRNGNYLGSNLTIEETLTDGSNYTRYNASYQSEGLKIYGLLTVPKGDKPETGWPVIIFNHGYIPPRQYVTTERYGAYTDYFARNGYIVFKSDYRGHGDSEGEANSYGSNGYTIDVLNALASLKKYTDADLNRIGMWGHSMGGFITLRAMVVNSDIKAGVIWAGVVASYQDMLTNWRRGSGTTTPSPNPTITGRGSWRRLFIEQFGTPQQNPTFWNSISANTYLSDISGPVQLHHGTSDTSVPISFSETLKTQMETAGKEVELYTYQGDDHNLSQNFNIAMKRSLAYFNAHLKR